MCESVLFLCIPYLVVEQFSKTILLVVEEFLHDDEIKSDYLKSYER